MTQKRNIYLSENQIKTIKEQIIIESSQDKRALQYLKSKGITDYSQQMEVIGTLKHDIPNLRLDNGRFMLAALRMYYDDGKLRDEQEIRGLDNALKYIHAGGHTNEYDFNLNGKSLEELSNTFRNISRQELSNDRERSANRRFTGSSEYNIIPINSYKEASKYGKYTSWCITRGKDAFDDYTKGGNRFYFCLRHGFEHIQKNDDGAPLNEYGLSMIAVNVDMEGGLTRVTTRYNHDFGGENNEGLETPEQLEDILNVPFYDTFKPYTRDELHAMGMILFDEVQELLDSGKKPEEIFEFVDKVSNEGLICVSLNDKWNFLSVDGKILSPNMWFNVVGYFHNGCSRVKLNDKFNFLDTKGRIVRPNQWFDIAGDFSDGYARISINDKWNFINGKGELLSPNQWFDHVNDFSCHYGKVKYNGKFNFINTEGELLSPNQWFDTVYGFSDEVALVQLDYKWNAINYKGELLSPNQWFDYIDSFVNGYAKIYLNSVCNFLDTKGRIISPNQWFHDCHYFHNGYSIVILDKKFNFINTEGKLLSPNQWFDMVTGFCNGYAGVVLNGKRCFISNKGNIFDNKDSALQDSESRNLVEESIKQRRIYLTENQVSEIKDKLKIARSNTNTSPTEKQKECGNYAKGRISVLGYDIVLENPKGTYRTGTDRNGKEWKTLMHNDYGYFSHTLAIDGDAVDVFLGNHFDTYSVFVIDQQINGKFDESKVMLGFRNEQEAKEAYLSNYEPGWNGFWRITEVTHDVFKDWLYNGYQHKKPFSDYKSIQKEKLNESIIEDEYEEYSVEYVLNEYCKNPNVKQQWTPLINPSMYQKALTEFSKYGKLTNFPTQYIYQWIGIIAKNTLILNANTELAGHTQWFPYDDLDDSDIFGFICQKYGFESIELKRAERDYICEIVCSPNYIINKILEEDYYLEDDELQFINSLQQTLNEGAIHQYGKNKGQGVMFIPQDELDSFDKKQEWQNKNKTIISLVEIYNRLYKNKHNKYYSECNPLAVVNNEGKIIIEKDVFVILDMSGIYDWMVMPDGSDAWSDFGLNPLFDILSEYDEDTTTPEQALVIVNRALDVGHQRGDMASIFIEGGSKSLSTISNGGIINENEYISYHGSPCRDIVTGKFRKGNHGKLGPGMYFSELEDYALKYAKDMGNGSVYKCQISMYKPLELFSINPTEEFLTRIYNTPKVYKRRADKQGNDNYIIQSSDVKKLLSLGYDGVIWDYADNKEYVVYDKNQIVILDNKFV